MSGGYSMIEQTQTVPVTDHDEPEMRIPVPRSGRSYDLYVEEVGPFALGCLDAPLY